MTTQSQVAIRPERDQVIEDKAQQLRDLFADAPDVAKRALAHVLPELTAHAAEEPSTMTGAGRAGSRQGIVSELTIIAPLTPDGARR
ncbi:MAG TPA: hypothetical protein VFG86_19030, partial [Chloroflexota bacterium]|nr:hypothetical protein [Chloroflexota bacterium]